MPMPWLVIGAGAALLGASQHSKVKKKNEEAQSYLQRAEKKYNRAKESLESAQHETESSLLALGTSKREVLQTSVRRFLLSWEKVKDVKLKESPGLNEISRFAITPAGALELAEMSDICQDKYSGAAKGVVTGGLISLAVSGSLPAVTGALASAGGALLAGNIAGAAGFAGSALALGAAVTPLAAIAAPVMLFTGFSANAKADENLSEARRTYSEAKRAVAKMETQETLCRAISERAEMFSALLSDVNAIFSPVTKTMERIISGKKTSFWSDKIKAEDLTDDECGVIAAARALAGAVKSILDTPILLGNGSINPGAEAECEDIRAAIPAYTEGVKTAEERYRVAEEMRVAERKSEAAAVVADETGGNSRAVSQTEEPLSMKLVTINFITSCIAAAVLYFAFERSLKIFIGLCVVCLIIGGLLIEFKERIPASFRNLCLGLGAIPIKIGFGSLAFGLAAYFIHPLLAVVLVIGVFIDEGPLKELM